MTEAGLKQKGLRKQEKAVSDDTKFLVPHTMMKYGLLTRKTISISTPRS